MDYRKLNVFTKPDVYPTERTDAISGYIKTKFTSSGASETKKIFQGKSLLEVRMTIQQSLQPGWKLGKDVTRKASWELGCRITIQKGIRLIRVRKYIERKLAPVIRPYINFSGVAHVLNSLMKYASTL